MSDSAVLYMYLLLYYISAVYTHSSRPMNTTVCMYGHHIYSKSRDQPGKVANPARGQLNRENEYFPVRVRA